MTVETIDGRAQQEFHKLPSFTIASRDGRSKFELVDMYAVERLQIAIKTKAPELVRHQWPHLKDIDSDDIGVGRQVGADHPAVIEDTGVP